MRLEDENTHKEIADFLNKNHHKHSSKTGPKEVIMTKQKVSDSLKDSVHAVVLVYGETIVDLTKQYDFTPMLTVGEFLKINKTDSIAKKLKMRDGKAPKDTQLNHLLSGKVICGHCDQAMHISVTSKNSSNKGNTKMF